MQTEPETQSEPIHTLTYAGKTVTLIGTAHVSHESVELVEKTIRDLKPDAVCVELCQSRCEAIRQKDQWQNMDIVKVIREKRAFQLLANLMLSAFQRRIAEQMNIRPGQEMITGMDMAEEVGSEIYLVDREIQITLSRIWRGMSLWEKNKLLLQLLLSLGDPPEVTAEDIEAMKETDMLQSVLAEVGQAHPALGKILIDERDQYLTHEIRAAEGNHVVAVVGAGHVPGIMKYWEKDIDIEELKKMPPKGKTGEIIKWGLPMAIIALFVWGFFKGGASVGANMIWWWIGLNGILAGIGAIAALAHPLTVLSAVVAAPITSLNPMIAAGWVSGLAEAILRKPKVRDLENLQDDILTARGFWKNNVTRILMVVVFTNIGSAIGTFVALPLMARLMG